MNRLKYSKYTGLCKKINDDWSAYMKLMTICLLALANGTLILAMDDATTAGNQATGEMISNVSHCLMAKCVLCDKNFTNMRNLRRHHDGMHLKKQQYACQHETCNKTYVRRYVCIDHMRKTGHLKNSFICKNDRCKKVFYFHEDMKKHVRTHARKKKKMWCGPCQLYLPPTTYYTHRERHNRETNQPLTNDNDFAINNLFSNILQVNYELLDLHDNRDDNKTL